MGEVKLACKVFEDCIQAGQLNLQNPYSLDTKWRLGRILEALVGSSIPGMIMALHLRQQVS